jgi:hypothetical protein
MTCSSIQLCIHLGQRRRLMICYLATLENAPCAL